MEDLDVGLALGCTLRYSLSLAVEECVGAVQDRYMVGFIGCLLYTSPSPRD